MIRINPDWAREAAKSIPGVSGPDFNGFSDLILALPGPARALPKSIDIRLGGGKNQSKWGPDPHEIDVAFRYSMFRATNLEFYGRPSVANVEFQMHLGRCSFLQNKHSDIHRPKQLANIGPADDPNQSKSGPGNREIDSRCVRA